MLELLDAPREEDEIVHVYPLMPVSDMQHHDAPLVVDAPVDDCWLCLEGICVQADKGDGIVLHATWAGH